MPYKEGVVLWHCDPKNHSEWTGLYVLDKFWPDNNSDSRYTWVNHGKVVEVVDPRDWRDNDA